MARKRKLFLFLAVMASFCGIGMFSCHAFEKEYVNSIGMKFVLIPAGSFSMGCNEGMEPCAVSELPRHRVTISRPFYMGVYEVTQREWEAIMGNNPSRSRGPTNPVDSVSWEDAQDFIRRLNKREGTKIFRLPTEAEWEYAVRAGSETVFFFGNDEKDLEHYAWYDVLPDKAGTLPVGQKKPNPWGLYDVYGNADEWTQDWFGKTYYEESPETDPPGASSGIYRVLRGGSWAATAWYCRSATRNVLQPDLRMPYFGLRLAADAVE